MRKLIDPDSSCGFCGGYDLGTKCPDCGAGSDNYDAPVGDAMQDILNQEIVRETLLEINPDTDDALVEKMWALCKGNPWNAVPLYNILKAIEK
jgi:hypothetical protein